MDIVGPLILSDKNENRYLLNVIDQLSKFAIAIPLYDIKSSDIISAIKTYVIIPHGKPEVILTDQGSNFCSKKTVEFFTKKLKAKHTTSSAYHAASNGQIERFNGTIIRSVAAIIRDDPGKWEDALDSAVYAYNNAVNETTGFPPFYLLKGHFEDSPQFLSLGCDSVKNFFKGSLEENRALARKRIEEMQEKNMRNANRKLIETHFQSGDKVLVISQPKKQQRSAKLRYHHEGPYEIVSKKTDNCYIIRDITSNRERRMNVVNLKRYYSRAEFTLWCESKERSLLNKQLAEASTGESPTNNEESASIVNEDSSDVV